MSVKTCPHCGYVSDTGEHCTTPGCPGNVAAWQKALDEARENNEKIIATVAGLFPFP